jgi:hypothetical protein
MYYRVPDFRGMSIPYAQSLPSATANKVNSVPGKPKIKVSTFQNKLPRPWARIAVKLKFAKIQIAETPQSVREASSMISSERLRQCLAREEIKHNTGAGRATGEPP